ncbi:hypothetical protein MUP77_14460 [Candidatus Bathyarchaeota archaeon]|nr:hypothetical protein [Candidatus Bathyarchaeota archaeon]
MTTIVGEEASWRRSFFLVSFIEWMNTVTDMGLEDFSGARALALPRLKLA